MLEGLPGARLGRRQLDLAPEALAGERHVRRPDDREPDRGPCRSVGAQAEPGRVARGPEDPGGILDEGERAERAESPGADVAPPAQRIDQVAEAIGRERHRHRVHREVPTPEILQEPGGRHIGQRARPRVPLAPRRGHVDATERGPVDTGARGRTPALDRRGPE